MKNAIFTLFLLLFSLQYGGSQISHFIFGPREVCTGCESYILEGIGPNQGQLEYLYITNNFDPKDSTCATISYSQAQTQTFACFFCPGQYTIHALAYFPDGNLVRDSFTVNVYPLAESYIVPGDSLACQNDQSPGECQKVCPGFTETYTLVSTLPQGITWSVSGAQSYTVNGNTVTVTWGNSGFGQVNANTFGQGLSCFSETSYCVEIKNELEATFTLPGNQFCANENFSPTPENLNGSRYEWDFGNGETSTDIVPVISYDGPGTYVITLKVYNECGCSGTFSSEVIIKDLFLPKIDCQSTICENTPVTYTTTADCGQFYWKIVGAGTLVSGGGLSDKSISIDWGQGPVGYVELEVAGCNFDKCPKKAVFEIPIVSDLANITGPTVACRNEVSMYTIQKYGFTSYDWVVQGGTITAGQGSNTILVSWSNGVSGSIEVSYDNCYLKCGGSAQLAVALAESYFIQPGSLQVCIGDLFTAVAYNSFFQNIAVDKWKVISPTGSILKEVLNNAQIQFEVPDGISHFTIAASSSSLCNGEQTKEIIVLQKSAAPTGIEGEFAICKNNVYTYKVVSNLPKAEYIWTVWDGSNKTNYNGSSIAHEWITDGPYKIEVRQTDLSKQLCLSNAYVKSAEKINNIDLTGEPSSCLYDEYTIKASFYEGLEYKWIINPTDAGSIISNDSNEVKILWSKAGLHSVQLSTCAGIFTKQVEVHKLPEPIVDHPAIACEDSPTGIKVLPGFVQAIWKNENGNWVADGNDVMLKPGTYTVEVKDINGCQSLDNFTIQQYPKPNVFLSTPDEEAICKSVPGWQYPELVVNTAEGGYQYQWFLDNVDLGISGAVYQTQATGQYHLVVTDLHSCTNVSNVLVVYDFCDPNDPGNGGGNGGGSNPCNSTTGTVDYTNTALDCNTIEFTSTSTQVLSNGYYWSFGDINSNQNTGSGSVVQHEFSNAGYYNVTHVVDVSDGTTGLTCQIVNKRKVPVEMAADFEFGLACQGAEVKFYDRTTYLPGISITSWEWDFGDPASGTDNTANTAEASHIYQNEGSYMVKLKVSNGTCTDEITKTITLYPKPNAAVLATGAVCENQASPIRLSPTGNIVKASWDFGDAVSGANNTYEGLEPYHQYDTPATYSLLVKAESIYGCKADLNGNILIHANTLNGPIASSLGAKFCDGLTTQLSAPAGGIQWQWSTGASTNAIDVVTTGIYQVELTDNFGCKFTTDNEVIEVIPLPESYIKSTVSLEEESKVYFDNTVKFCAGADFTIEAIQKNSWAYTWSTGVLNHQLQFNEQTGNKLIPGTYNLYVDIKDLLTGCINREGPVEVVVNGLPAAPQITANNSGTLCEGILHMLSVVSPQPGLTYQWTTGKKSNQIEVKTAASYAVFAKDANGCTAKSNEISIVNGPDASLVPSGCFERCAPDTICFPTIANTVAYQWYKNGNVLPAADGGNNPYPVITMDGDYHLQLTGTNGCVTQSEPLNLMLKTPVGTLKGKVYSDVNTNGIIDNTDTLLNGVILMASSVKDTTEMGIYELINLAAGQVTIEVDTHSLPQGSKILTTQLTASLVGCDDEAQLDILIGINCISQEKTINYLLCPGELIEIEGENIGEDANLTFIKPQPGGCADTFHYLVEVKQPILASIQTEAACPGIENGSITLNTNTLETYSVQINGQLQSGNGNSWNGFQAGNYLIELIDADNCITQYNTGIEEKATPIFTLNAENLTCAKPIGQAMVQLVNYTAEQVTIQWSNQGTGISTEVTKAGMLSVMVNNGCGEVSESIIIEQEKAKHEFKKYIVCNGNSLNLLNQDFAQDTVFNLLATATNGCVDTTTYDLNFSPEYDIDLEVNGSCPGQGNGSIIINNANPGQFSYFLNEQAVVLNNQAIGQLYYGTYKLTIKDNIGCQENVTVDIPEKEEVKFNLVDEDISCFKGFASIGIELINYEESDLTIQWNTGNTKAKIETAQAGNYILTFNNGCEEKSLDFEVGTTDKLPSFDLPNILAPVGQNAMVDLQLTPFANSEVIRFDIFDRMGKLVHKSSPGNLMWDGRFGTNPMPSGVYVYFIEANVDVCGKTENMKKAGTITVLR